jgi:hypothetical protein
MTVRSRTKFVSLVTLLSMTTALVPPAAFAAPLQANDDIAIPPTSQPSIGDVLLANAVSFAWFGEGWNQAAAQPTNPNNEYCNICNPFNYQTQLMTSETLRGTASPGHG